ncbi:MAG: AgmX/PglI C-terminal domain-containing protein, partial [Myxococcota bacterium]|nr:AgmX/PglI C-terminal domain-containing protein [Myxococcota bacterium]
HLIRTSRAQEQAVAGASELRARLGVSGREQAPANSAAAEPVDWYYSSDGQSFGPFTKTALLGKFKNAELGAECYVWHRDLGEWKAAHSTAPFGAVIGARASRPSLQLAQVVKRESGVQATAAAVQPAVSSERLQNLRQRLDGVEKEEDDQAATLVDDQEPEQAEEGEDDGGIDLDIDGASRVVSYASLLQAHRGRQATAAQEEPSEQDRAREALFAAIEQTRQSLPESAPVERSMIIHIDHLRQQNRKVRLYAFGALGLVALVIGVIALISIYGESEIKAEDSLLARSVMLAQVGRTLDADELERIAPETEFSMAVVEEEASEEAPQESAHKKPSKSTSKPKKLVDAKSISAGIVGEIDLEGLDSSSPDGAGTKLGQSGGPNIKTGTGALTSATSYSGVPTTRRSTKLQLDGNPAFDEMPEAPAASSTRKVSGDQRNQFMSGLKQVSKSVQECHKRQMKDGTTVSAKIYISLTVEPSGNVSKVTIDKKVQGSFFEKCLLSKVDRWTFDAFEGKTVELKQGFVLE